MKIVTLFAPARKTWTEEKFKNTNIEIGICPACASKIKPAFTMAPAKIHIHIHSCPGKRDTHVFNKSTAG